MAHHRRIGADDGTVLMACSICGNSFRYPTEIRLCSDRLWRCNQFCTEATNELQQSEIQARGRRRAPEELKLPRVGIKPSWFD